MKKSGTSMLIKVAYYLGSIKTVQAKYPNIVNVEAFSISKLFNC